MLRLYTTQSLSFPGSVSLPIIPIIHTLCGYLHRHSCTFVCKYPKEQEAEYPSQPPAPVRSCRTGKQMKRSITSHMVSWLNMNDQVRKTRMFHTFSLQTSFTQTQDLKIAKVQAEQPERKSNAKRQKLKSSKANRMLKL